MNNFEYNNPTRIIFGKGQIAAINEQIPKDARVLLLYGGGSIKNNGVFEQTIAALGNRFYLEFAGIEPNPSYETASKAIALTQDNQIDYLLAVGGGSVADATKFIAAGVYCSQDPWQQLMVNRENVEQALPIGVILTLPATGSESNMGAVITLKANGDKLAFMHPRLYPKFAVLDPETTYSLPEKQSVNGVIDAFVHTTEQYLTYPVDAKIQDRYAEGILQTLIEEGAKVIKTPNNYQTRANIMWSANQALNGLIGQGVPQDWATHMIGHELTALYGLDHAQTLAIVLPSLLRVCINAKQDKLLQYGERIWGITSGSISERCEQAIVKTEQFFNQLGCKTKLSSYVVNGQAINEQAIEPILAQLKRHGMTALGENQQIDLEVSRKILLGCL